MPVDVTEFLDSANEGHREAWCQRIARMDRLRSHWCPKGTNHRVVLDLVLSGLSVEDTAKQLGLRPETALKRLRWVLNDLRWWEKMPFLELDSPAANLLRRHGYTEEMVRKASDEELRSLRNLGVKSLQRIRAVYPQLVKVDDGRH